MSKTTAKPRPAPIKRPENAVVTVSSQFNRQAAMALGVLLIAFVALQCFLPLKTAIQVGADEGFELAKATLCLKGFHLYTDVWNDQPPLHTFLTTQILKHVSASILGPRLVTTAFTLLLLASVFLIGLRVNGLMVATVTTAFLIASPGFLTLGSSCMLEIPALGPAVAALCLLLWGGRRAWAVPLAGMVFGVSLETKLITLILLPLVALILWSEYRDYINVLRLLLLFGFGLVLSFVALDLLIERGAFLLHLQQTWVSHFAPAKSFEYGSADDHPFDWIILLRNWDTTLPAIAGVVFLLRQPRKSLLPLAWLGLMLVIFTIHRPWWSYYYVHLAIPLCWCAAIGIAAVRQQTNSSKSRVWAALFAFFVYWAPLWMGARVYLQVVAIRNSPQTYTSPVLTEIQRFKPFTSWMYADERIYSFHAGIPLPPSLGVVMLKRLWSGEMTNERINAEMTAYKPGLILLANDTRVVPFKELMDAEYRLVYQDGDQRLYALKEIARKAKY